MELVFLGSADSAGIPSHNCMCQICQEYRAQSRVNLATSAYIRCENGEIILLDAGIENIATIFDLQTIKAVCLTHFHPDHALGLLRLRYSQDKILCYHPKDHEGFSDLFKHKKSIHYIENTAFIPFSVNELTITPIPLMHSKNTNGYIIKSPEKTIAYLTDCFAIPQDSMETLIALDIDECYLDAALSPDVANGNHLNYKDATLLLDEIGAKTSYLIHASHYTLEYIKRNKIQLKYKYI